MFYKKTEFKSFKGLDILENIGLVQTQYGEETQNQVEFHIQSIPFSYNMDNAKEIVNIVKKGDGKIYFENLG